MLNEKMKYIHSIIIVLRKKRKHQYVNKKWLFLNYEIISDYFKKKTFKIFSKTIMYYCYNYEGQDLEIDFKLTSLKKLM